MISVVYRGSEYKHRSIYSSKAEIFCHYSAVLSYFTHAVHSVSDELFYNFVFEGWLLSKITAKVVSVRNTRNKFGMFMVNI